ncbi:MAG: ABC transporter permease [Saprospiraceae bacterium]|nr:ABC transporter permease [Saprospiraceae bacterium]
MIRNYLKIGLRNLIRQKSFSLINVVGLAIGLASSILIFIWIKNELSYDQFNEDRARIYRITCQVENIRAAITPAPLAPAMRDQFPEVSEALRLTYQRSNLFQVGNQKYEEKSTFFVDSNFFNFFSYSLAEGHRDEVLKQPQSIVISPQMAEKYFGNENPLGRLIKMDNKDDMVVTGVLGKNPTPSHLHFDFLIPMSYLARTEEDLRENRWDNFNYYSYVKLNKANSVEESKVINERIDALYTENESELKVDFVLQPLSKIHLFSDFHGDVAGHGDIQYIYIFLFTAIFILIIACINFMNLSTARAARRAREVGFRKVAGAYRYQLINQFLTESTLIAFLSLVLAIGIIFLTLPAFNLVTNQEMGMKILDPVAILSIFGLTLFIGVLAGSYPAFYLSGFEPVKVFSLQKNAGTGHRLFRNGLVIIQFVFSIILIIGTISIHQQQSFIRNRNLGFDQENLVYMPLRGPIRNNQDALRSALAGNNLTDQFSLVGELPTNLLNATIDVEWDGKDPNQQVVFSNMDVDDHFLKVFDMTILTGRTFSEEFKSDDRKYIVNEKALEIMDMDAEQAIGKKFSLWSGDGTIVGVIRDFHFKPIQQPIDPIVMRYTKNGQYAVIRTEPGKTDETIAAMERIYQSLNPEYPFEFGFLDQDIENQYQSEATLGKLVNIFAMLAIFISCLGLYGLSAFLAERRKKEISIRKVVGASVANVVFLLVKDFTKPIWLAMIIALPVSFLIVNQWLQNFAYHIDIKWWVFLLACLTAWFIAIVTVSFETLRAAFAHPSAALQNE